MEKSFFKTKIGQQTIAGLVTVSAFPFLYLGGVKDLGGLIFIGMSLVIVGMASAPVITFLHGWNTDNTVKK